MTPPPFAATHVDAALCPLCGFANGCAAQVERLTGQTQPDCWCMRTPMPAAVLARIPAQARDLACVCQRCAAMADAAPAPGRA